jgi:Cdc6-like AAA superfamily ATPase
VLLKPVTHEIELTKKKMDVVIINCVESGSPKRVLEQLLHSVSSTLLNELNK